MLFPPHQTPNPDKYVEWSEPLPLSGPDSVALVGPFNFEKITSANRVRRLVGHKHLETLTDICSTLGMSPPTLGTTSPTIPFQP